MSRTSLTWTIFAGALALVFVVMTFFTVKMLQFENAMADAQARAALEENVRLALWRMDSAASVLYAQKSSESPAISSNGNLSFANSNSGYTGQNQNAAQRFEPANQQQMSEQELQQRASVSQTGTGDWHSIAPMLLDRISDILPGATLEGVADKQVDPNDTRRLASIPARLVVPASALPSASQPWNTPLRISLMISWSCVILAALGVAKLLGATLALSERRGAFASAVTHELRTPLTTCRMYAEMLASGMITDPAARQQYLDTLLAESDRLGHLIENVLTYSQLERRISPNRAQTLDVNELVDPALASLRRRVQQAGFELNVKISEDAAKGSCRTDPITVQQILLNLVDNACKYGQSPIELSVGVAGKNLEFRVADHGPGVDLSRARHLFAPFNKSKTSTIPGIGLGLYLSRRLARGLGGDLMQIPSQMGAIFAFTLPIGDKEPRTPEEPPPGSTGLTAG